MKSKNNIDIRTCLKVYNSEGKTLSNQVLVMLSDTSLDDISHHKWLKLPQMYISRWEIGTVLEIDDPHFLVREEFEFSYFRIFVFSTPCSTRTESHEVLNSLPKRVTKLKKIPVLALFSKIAAKPAGNLNPRDSLVGGRKAFTFSREL